MELEKETALVETVLFLESEPVPVKTISIKAQLSEDVVDKCIAQDPLHYISRFLCCIFSGSPGIGISLSKFIDCSHHIGTGEGFQHPIFVLFNANVYIIK